MQPENSTESKLSRKGMTAKERRFAEEYAKDEDLLRAYLAAGYPMAMAGVQRTKAEARKVLVRPKIREHIDRVRDAERDRAAISPESILRQFQDVVESCRQRGDFANANRALENLGKARGLFESKSQHNVVVTHLETGNDIGGIKRDIKRIIGLLDYTSATFEEVAKTSTKDG